MLHQYLQAAIKDLNDLIQITQKDIEDIKEARHNELFERNGIKKDLINAFENKKAIIDNEIAKLAKENPNTPLQELLDDECSRLLDELRETLKTLKEYNKHYARMVLAVSEFYNSLLDRLLPAESNGYEQKSRSSSFLQVTA